MNFKLIVIIVEIFFLMSGLAGYIGLKIKRKTYEGNMKYYNKNIKILGIVLLFGLAFTLIDVAFMYFV